MKTKEEFYEKWKPNGYFEHNPIEFMNDLMSVINSDLTNAKLVEENEVMLEDLKMKDAVIAEFEEVQHVERKQFKQLQSELSAAKERVKELEKNARQLCTLLAKDHILFFLSQGEKDGIMDILKTLAPKQHG